MKIKFYVFFFFYSLSGLIFAGDGNIVTGKVFDAKTNEPIPLVNVIVTDLKTGTSTDFEGSFRLKLPEGKYKIEFKTLGYETVVKEIEVKGDQPIYLEIEMIEANQNLDEVVIKASKRKNTERSVLALQKKSIAIVDGLSAQTFKTSGVGNLASAVKKVVGVSVENGKYVYVRGLGDRYTKTILNKTDIPGLDPDRNTIQMDIFSTSILENILVYKTFTADLPADFTGGVVNLVTKDFPDKSETNISIGLGYNPEMNFESQFLSFEGGKTDLLGIDDGTYEIPIPLDEDIPYTFDNDPKLTEITKKFNPVLGAKESSTFLNYNFSLYHGNRFDVGEDDINSLGYILTVSYKQDYKFYENYQSNLFDKDPDKSIYELRKSKIQSGNLGVKNGILTTLTGFAFKTKKSKYKLNFLHIRNGEKSASILIENNYKTNFNTYKRHYLAYTQRNISNLLLNGIHSDLKDINIDWKLSYTRSGIYDKDVRAVNYLIENNQYIIETINRPKRIWRNLTEDNFVGKFDFNKKYKKGKLSIGLMSTYKYRDYSIYNYEIGIKGNLDLTGNGDEILYDENIWTPQTDKGSYIVNQSVFNKSNLYDAKQYNFGFYASNQYEITDKLKSVLGLRIEKFMLLYTGQNNMGTIIYNDDTVIDKLDFFPSVNLTYSLNDDTNFRFSYAKTTARPSFKEASIAQIYDPLSNMTFIGNIDLKPTYIDNLDLRYEKYGEKANYFAISSFFKYFKDPIELAFYQVAPNNYTPRNLGNATVYGVEVELRQNLGFVAKQMENLKFKMNVSYIVSKMKMYEDEYQLRLNTARIGEEVSQYRPLQGQAPYLINAGLVYDNKEKGITADLSFNTQGETLERVGAGLPDVYSKAFNSLNLNVIKKVGKNGQISFKISNILNDDKELYYKNFNADKQIFSLKNQGRSFSLKYTVRF